MVVQPEVEEGFCTEIGNICMHSGLNLILDHG